MCSNYKNYQTKGFGSERNLSQTLKRYGSQTAVWKRTDIKEKMETVKVILHITYSKQLEKESGKVGQ